MHGNSNGIGFMINFSKPKRNFPNLNADSWVKVKVKGIKFLFCMKRSCPKACVCQILKVYNSWYGSYKQFSKPKHKFWNLNADSKVKVKVKGVKVWYAWKGLVPRHVYGKYKSCTSIGMVAIINKLVGANANANADADANDWVTTLALLDFVRRAKKWNRSTTQFTQFMPINDRV